MTDHSDLIAELRVACPHCERTVATANDLYNHVKAKHGAKLARKLPRPKVEREQSVGEWLADALLDYAAGIEPDEALMLMFPEQFREVRRVRDRR